MSNKLKLSDAANAVFEKIKEHAHDTAMGLEIITTDFKKLPADERVKILTTDEIAFDITDKEIMMGVIDHLEAPYTYESDEKLSPYIIAELFSAFAEAGDTSPIITSVSSALADISDKDYQSPIKLGSTIANAIEKTYFAKTLPQNVKHNNPFKK